jgi:hypothetical protein
LGDSLLLRQYIADTGTVLKNIPPPKTCHPLLCLMLFIPCFGA